MHHVVTPDPSLDPHRLRAAIAQGNIPSLLPVLYQLTGDQRWLHEPYFPQRTKGFEELNTGGLPDEIQAEIRAAAVDAVLAWANGTPAAVPTPSDDALVAAMTACMGEQIPAEYVPMVAEHLGFAPYIPPEVGEQAREHEFSVVIIGAGVSGLTAAIALRRAGIPFTVLEKNDEVGGTWWENRYPGARVDIPSNLYSLSFAPANWSEHFGQRDEIAGYFQGIASSFDLRTSIKFQHEVVSARWDEHDQHWTLEVTAPGGQREEVTANALITAVGLHNRPKIPDFPGLDRFHGDVFHSARWPDQARVDGKRVGVVGAGASSMQVVTAIARRVEALTVLQRSPQWVAPNEYYFASMPEHTNWLFDHVPYYRGWYRFRLYWLYTERLYAPQLLDPEWQKPGSINGLSDAFRKLFTGYLRQQLEGHDDLQRKALPDYPPLGKRLLLDNGWFSALKKPHVELLTEEIEQVTETGIVTTAGQRRELDTLVLCTGFHQQRFLYPLDVRGRDGRTLREDWHDDDGRAYLGITTPGYPNLFFLYGPNSNPPGGSYITVAEAQVRYIVETLTRMVREGIGSVECRQEPFEKYNKELDEGNARMVYAQDGVHNYYRNNEGRVVTNFPWPVVQYWSMTRSPNFSDFTVTPVSHNASAARR